MKKIGLIFLMVLLVTLSACGIEKPENSVSSALNAIKAYDMKTAKEYFVGVHTNDLEDATADDSEELTKKLFQNLSFSIEKASVKGDKAVVTTKITNIDMVKFMSSYMQRLFKIAFSGDSEDGMDAQAEKLLATMMDEKNDTVSTTVDINLVQADGKWKIDPSDKLLDAILGGLLSATDDLEKKLGGSDGELDMED